MGFALITVLLLLPGLAAAQSPYRLGWDSDGPVIVAAGALAATKFATDRHLPGMTADELESLSADEVNALDRGAIRHYSEKASTASTVLEFTLAASPLLLFTSQGIRGDFATVGAMYVEMLAFSAIVPQIAKGAVDRPRPYAYNSAVPYEKRSDPYARQSFFSQHTTFAFASAVFLSTVYGDYFPESTLKPFVWIGSLSAASVVGILRYTSGYHFPTDILLGAAVGAAIGFVIPLVHRRNGPELETSAAILPGGAAFSFRYAL